jgi:WD40-like Beta Propeller Repeat
VVPALLPMGEGWKAQTLSSAGGAAEDLLPKGGGGVDFNWSPDGNILIFSIGPEYGPTSIRILDLKTHEVSEFAGSKGFFSPRRSPDGRYLATLTQDSSTLMRYDFPSTKMVEVAGRTGKHRVPQLVKGQQLHLFRQFSDRPADGTTGKSGRHSFRRNVQSGETSPFSGDAFRYVGRAGA